MLNELFSFALICSNERNPQSRYLVPVDSVGCHAMTDSAIQGLFSGAFGFKHGLPHAS